MKRFDCTTEGVCYGDEGCSVCGKMDESDIGDWVRFDDVATLKSERDELKADLVWAVDSGAYFAEHGYDAEMGALFWLGCFQSPGFLISDDGKLAAVRSARKGE